jgi:hypothetical protein
MNNLIKDVLNKKNLRKFAKDYLGNKITLGSYITYNDGHYKGKTKLNLGLVCGFTKVGVRIITKATHINNYDIIIQHDDKTILTPNVLISEEMLKDFRDVENELFLPQKLNML